jgi:sphinganine-1-phosphate aldolase
MAVKAARERGKEIYGITEPEMILSRTAHPAFFKAAHYFNVKCNVIEIDEEMKLIVNDAKNKINKNTILLVVSAPQYPHGVIDPVEEIAKIGKEKDIPVHVGN